MQFSPYFLERLARSKFVEKLEQGVVEIDNSEFMTWGSCFTMGLFSGGLKRTSARSRSPLAFGSAVHVGLETFFKNPNSKWLDAGLAEAATNGLDDMGDPKRNSDKLESLLRAYVLEYERNESMQFRIADLAGSKAVEQSFSIPLGEVEPSGSPFGVDRFQIMWQGKIDLITIYDGAICPVDHKTTSIMGEKFVDDKVRSSQMLGYTFAARYLGETVFDNRVVFGTRINALAMRSAGFEFKLFDIPYPEWKVAEWQRETLTIITRLIEQLSEFMSTGQAMPTREHCVTKYGKCPYFDVCDSTPQMRDRMIFDDSYFFESTWSPLND